MKSVNITVQGLFLSLKLGLLCLSSAAWGSTKVGNGGDIMAVFLEQIRFSIVEVASLALKQGEVNLCDKVERLNEEEQQYCNRKLSEVLPDLVKILSSRPIVPLVIQDEEIYVDLPEGKRRPVMAITDCGKEGAIFFHFSGVRLLSPGRLFHLMTHEFLHKVPFEGRECLQDLDTPGPFNEIEGGRRLLDAMADAMVIYAKGVGKIAQDMGISDSFNCVIRNPKDSFVLRHEALGTRLFFEDATSGNYTAGIGLLPRDGNCQLENSQLSYKVSLSIKIDEKGNCDHQDQKELRKTTVTLVKSYTSKDPNIPVKESEVLEESVYEGVNPLCNWHQGENLFSATLTLDDGRQWIYGLEYLYSKGNFSRGIRNRLGPVRPYR